MTFRVLATRLAVITLTIMAGLGIATGGTSASTLDSVREAGLLRCGVQEIGPAFSNINQDGRWVGFYADLCRATAAAVLDDPEAVEFVIVGTDDRFSALRGEEFDVLMSSATWTLGRDADGLTFMPLYLFDGQGFLVHKRSGANDVADLKDAILCVEDHTTSLANAQDYSDSHQLNWTITPFSTVEGAMNAFFEGQCDATTNDLMALASTWNFLSPNLDEDKLLPTQISKEPLAGTVREGDDEWADVVRWVINAVITAEELGVTQANLEEMKASDNPAVRRLLGIEGDLGESLGLDSAFAVRALKASGNYGEIYDRTIKKELRVERGINSLWTDGGLIWAPPMR